MDYFDSPEDLRAILIELLSRSQKEVANLVSQAQFELIEDGYENWDGGTRLYTLVIKVAPDQFALNEEHIEEYENLISEKLRKVLRRGNGKSINQIVIEPIQRSLMLEAPGTSSDIWESRNLKVFLSHSSTDKAKAHALREKLAVYGFQCFVAHDDIQPNREWSEEILKALRSCDVFVLLCSERASSSIWVNQECGFATARGIPMIALRLGADPPGFLSFRQGLAAKDSKLLTARRIAEVILTFDKIRFKVNECLVNALQTSSQFDDSKELIELICKNSTFSLEECKLMLKYARENYQVYGSNRKLVEKLEEHIRSFMTDALNEQSEEIDPLFDEYDPFSEE